jgi:hypothetical protein
VRSVVAFVVSAAAVAALAGWLRGPARPGVLAAAAGVVMLYLSRSGWASASACSPPLSRSSSPRGRRRTPPPPAPA